MCFIFSHASSTKQQILNGSRVESLLLRANFQAKIHETNVVPSRHLLRTVSRLSRIPLSLAGPLGLPASLVAPRYIISRPAMTEPVALALSSLSLPAAPSANYPTTRLEKFKEFYSILKHRDHVKPATWQQRSSALTVKPLDLANSDLHANDMPGRSEKRDVPRRSLRN